MVEYLRKNFLLFAARVFECTHDTAFDISVAPFPY